MKKRTDNGWKDQDKKRAYQREWVRKRREEYIARRGGACEKCGCTVDLEFHHTKPLVKVTHRIFSYSRKRIEKELSTCLLLCRIPCHKNEQKKVKHAFKRRRRQNRDSVIGVYPRGRASK